MVGVPPSIKSPFERTPQMLTQKRKAVNKIHSIHVLPNGAGFAGKIKAGGLNYHFAFMPKTAASLNGKLVLTGLVKAQSSGGRRQVANDVTATFFATQGSTT